MRKYYFMILLSFLYIPLVFSETSSSSINWASQSWVNNYFCRQNGNCNLSNLNVVNTTIVNSNITGDVNAYSYSLNGTNLDDRYWNEDGDTGLSGTFSGNYTLYSTQWANFSEGIKTSRLIALSNASLANVTIQPRGSIQIGNNQLNGTEWAFLDGINQSLSTDRKPRFEGVTIGGTDWALEKIGTSLYLYRRGAEVPGIMFEQDGDSTWGYEGTTETIGGTLSVEQIIPLDFIKMNDYRRIFFGTGGNTSIYFDGTDLKFETNTRSNATKFNPTGQDTDFYIYRSGGAPTLFLNANQNGVNRQPSYFREAGPVDAGYAFEFQDTAGNNLLAIDTVTDGLRIGDAVAGLDYCLFFEGQSNQGNMCWQEDENRFSFGNNVLASKQLNVTDTATFYGRNPIVINNTVWDDINFGGGSLAAGAFSPTLTSWNNTLAQIYCYAGTVRNEYSSGCVEMPHKWKEESDIEVHLHWSPSTATLANVNWTIDYLISNMTGSYIKSGTITNTSSTGGKSWNNVYADFHDIDMAGFGLGTQVCFRVTRTQDAATDTYTDCAGIKTVGLHYESDALGSSTEYNKFQ